MTVSSHVMDAARKQRMNTEVRRNVFSVLMSSEVRLWSLLLLGALSVLL